MALISLQHKLDAFSIGYEAAKLKHKLWWRLMPGTEIVVRWPVGWSEPDDLGNSFESTDPNSHYRPWMESNVGRQCWDWDWDVNADDADSLVIRFRRGKESEAMQAWIRWG